MTIQENIEIIKRCIRDIEMSELSECTTRNVDTGRDHEGYLYSTNYKPDNSKTTS